MSYQVLARKWRPKRFAELVGQEHVVRALSHALDSGRIHHAFLFTGTRGVGKTTIARIFAKSLNCERGVGAEPCGECGVCRDVDAGRFLDLVEIDAASNTGVDDVRELIENAQYMPVRGRYKVYLIDEVHMLSKNAFNALLKTLEEPPGHVKFLLATTDPQKLPITVLSRCLQFNLRRLSDEQIDGQLGRILAAEAISAEPDAVRQIARGGNGSLRDALSLLDQAIAFGGGQLRTDDVQSMLGTVDRGPVLDLLDAIVSGDAPALARSIEAVVSFAPDFGAVLDELAVQLHRVQVAQLVPEVGEAEPRVVGLAARIAAEETQVLYQMAIHGRRDLGLAPNPRIGFEMCLLRMLAFRPDDGPATSAGGAGAGAASAAAGRGAPAAPSRPAPRAQSDATPVMLRAVPDTRPSAERPVALPAVAAAPAVTPVQLPSEVEPVAATSTLGSDAWLDLVGGLSLRGLARELASNAALLGFQNQELRLALKPELGHLHSEVLSRQLADALRPSLGAALKIKLETSAAATLTWSARLRADAESRQSEAERAVAADPIVRSLVETFDARIVPNSTRAR